MRQKITVIAGVLLALLVGILPAAQADFTIPNAADALHAVQAQPDKVDLDILAAAYQGNGVISGLAVSQRGAGANMSVDVAAGQARVGGYFPFVAAANVSVSAAHASLPRLDLVSVDYNGVLTVTAGTAAAAPVLPAIPANSIVLATVYVPANDTTITDSQLTDKRLVVANVFDGEDDFEPGSTETGEIGQWSWNTTASGTAANAQQAGEASHPGIWRAQSGTTSGNNSRIHLGNAVTTGVVIPTDVARLRWIIRIPTVSSIIVKIGMGQDISVSTADQWGTAGMWIELDSAGSANWQTETRQASTTTTNTGASAVTANNWYDIEQVQLQNGNWQFVVNKTILFTHSANQPTTACNLGVLVHTVTAAARNIDIDFFGINYKPLGNRHT